MLHFLSRDLHDWVRRFFRRNLWRRNAFKKKGRNFGGLLSRDGLRGGGGDDIGSQLFVLLLYLAAFFIFLARPAWTGIISPNFLHLEPLQNV
jgi:hypothetical protein